MSVVNMLDAKTNLSRLVEAVASGAEKEIVIARNGRPAAKLIAVGNGGRGRIGIAKGKFVVPDNIDEDEARIIALFHGDSDDDGDA